jgi:hypothetical protein
MKKQLEEMAARFWEIVAANKYELVRLSAVSLCDYKSGKHDFYSVYVKADDVTVLIFIMPKYEQVHTDLFGSGVTGYLWSYTQEWLDILNAGIEAMEEKEVNHG